MKNFIATELKGKDKFGLFSYVKNGCRLKFLSRVSAYFIEYDSRKRKYTTRYLNDRKELIGTKDIVACVGLWDLGEHFRPQEINSIILSDDYDYYEHDYFIERYGEEHDPDIMEYFTYYSTASVIDKFMKIGNIVLIPAPKQANGQAIFKFCIDFNKNSKRLYFQLYGAYDNNFPGYMSYTGPGINVSVDKSNKFFNDGDESLMEELTDNFMKSLDHEFGKIARIMGCSNVKFLLEEVNVSLESNPYDAYLIDKDQVEMFNKLQSHVSDKLKEIYCKK